MPEPDLIWHWIAWNHGRERFCDCGTVLAGDDETARRIASQCIGGPHLSSIVEISVRRIQNRRGAS